MPTDTRDNPRVADDALSGHETPPADDKQAETAPARARYDAHGRLAPGSLPGWGMSWWLHEQGLLAGWQHLSMSARLEHMSDYWRAVSDGWWPSVPRDEWVGSCHPWEPEH
jgi:hypothetical protein